MTRAYRVEVEAEVEATESPPRSPTPPLSPWWRHGVILVLIFGFSVLGVVTALTYKNAPPIPTRVVDPSGLVVFTGEEIERGQEVFLKHGLMDHGTLWGHGAYLGPDYTAEHLHQEVKALQQLEATRRFGQPFESLRSEQRALVEAGVRSDLKTNRYDPGTGTLTLSASEVEATRRVAVYWSDYFTRPNTAPGLPAQSLQTEEIRLLGAYFSWATWATVTNRPGQDYTYTNNWPYDPEAGNGPSTEAYIWSAISLVVLLGGLGVILLVFGRYHFLGWEGHPDDPPAFLPAVLSRPLTPSQRATGKYFVVVAALFLLQVLFGGALAHYRCEPFSFYGLEAIVRWMPYTLARTYHLQLTIFWIATAWVAGGLFLAPWVGGIEPRGQKLGVDLLFWALVLVVGGSMAGEFLGLTGRLDQLWFWFGHQGSEYLELGRFWQFLLAAGLLLWLVLMFRALRPSIRKEGKTDLSALFLYGAAAIPLFYLPAVFYGPRTNFAVIDNWRFWIIHLWVEGFFELFATVMVAIMFLHIGLVGRRTATRVVYLDALLFLTGGIVGIGHHWYFTGQSTLNMGLAACFSALEVVPLTLLTLDAWGFVRRARNGPEVAQKQRWAIRFLVAVGVWNFLGAGVFGFLINTPIVSYFEMGTVLTTNHGHAAMFGVFGMLALGVLVFVVRALQTDAAWNRTERYVRLGFWGLNAGLGLMIVLDLFPAGVLQLWDVITHGYWHARQLQYTMAGLFHALEWARLGGDGVFILLGALPIALGTLRAFLVGELAPARR